MNCIDPPNMGGSKLIKVLKKSLKETRRKKFFLLSDFSYDLFIAKTSEIVSKIFTTYQITDPQKCIKIATKIFIYMKLRKEYFLQFFTTLENLFPDDESAIITCAYTQSKLMKLVPHDFLKKLFTSFINKHQNFSINLAYFAYFMINESTKSALFCINELIDLLSQIIYSSDQNVRFIAFDSLNKIFKILSNSSNSTYEEITLRLFFHAKEKLESNLFSEQHGSFLLLSSIFQKLPCQIISQSFELINFFISLLNSPQIHSISLYSIVVLSRYDKPLFLKTYFTPIFDVLITDSCSNSVTFLTSYNFLIFYRTFSEEVISNETELLKIFDNLIQHQEMIKQVYQVIQHISKNHPFFIQKNIQFFSSLFLRSIQFPGEIIHIFVEVINLFPALFDADAYSSALLAELEREKPSSLIEFISLCPPLNNSKIEGILIGLLSSTDEEIRGLAPAALLNQVSYADRDIVCALFNQLFAVALSDPSPGVRLKVVTSFDRRSFKCLTLPGHLECLTSLAHDESVEVRNASIRLLGILRKHDPLSVHAILRGLLLDHLISIDMKSLKSAKARIVRSLVPLFEASIEILPLYCSTFCDIALRELSDTPCQKLTYFEQKFFVVISANIIKSIGFIAGFDASLIRSHVKQFVTFFVWQLQQEIAKELKLSIIKTIYVILSSLADQIDEIDLNQLNKKLIEFASKWNSKKLNKEILKLIGFIGLSSNKGEIEINSESQKSVNTVPSDPSYFISCACQTLFDILDDCRYFSYHMSCLKALSVIFSNDGEMYGQNYFSKFVLIVIDQVRLTNSPEHIEILNQVCKSSPRAWVLKYKAEIINLAQEMLERRENPERILNFIPTLCKVFKSDAEIFYQNGISLLYGILEKSMKKDESVEIGLRCLSSIISMRSVSNNFCFLNLPKLLDILGKKNVVPKIKYKIVDAISFFYQQDDMDMSAFSPSILRSLSDTLLKIDLINDQVFIEKIMQSIYSIMAKSGSSFCFYEKQTTCLIDSLKNLSDSERNNYHSILNRKPPFSFSDFTFIKILKTAENQDRLNNDKVNSNAPSQTKSDQNVLNDEDINSNAPSQIVSDQAVLSNNGTDSNALSQTVNDQAALNDESMNCSSNAPSQTSLNDENINSNTPSQTDDSRGFAIVDEEAIMQSVSIADVVCEKVTDRSIAWKCWYARLVAAFISHSPSPYISSCSFLCDSLFPVADSCLFRPSFLCVWLFVTEKVRHFISESLAAALSSSTIPNRYCSSIISVIEFLDRNEFDVAIPKRLLCVACQKCHLYSSAYYFGCRWLAEEPCSVEASEKLIAVSAYFGQLKLKKGLAKIAQKKVDVSNSPRWFEIIGHWSSARKMYEEKGYTANFGRIVKCLEKEQNWDEIIEKVDLFESIEKVEIKQSSSKSILNALYHRHQWDKMSKVFPFADKAGSIKVLTILALFQNWQGKKKEAIETIESAFNILSSKVKETIKNDDQIMIEKVIFKSQQLQEALEIINLEDDRTFSIEKIWNKRISKLPKKFDFFSQILALRHSIGSPSSESQLVVKMLKSSLKEELYQLFETTVRSHYPDESKIPLPIAFLRCQFLWETGQRAEAIEKVDSLLKDPLFVPRIESNQAMKCEMYCTYAEWIIYSSTCSTVFHRLKQVVELIEVSMRTKIRLYKPFHYWAWCCSLMFMKASSVQQHAVSAVHGFLECIKLKGEKTPFDDLIQMTSLFFNTSFEAKSFDEISKRIGKLSDEPFLLIVPQMFAQISSNEKSPQSMFIGKILMRLLPDHFHVLLPDLLFDREPNALITSLSNWFAKKNAKAFNEGTEIKKGLVLSSCSTLENWQVELTKTIAAVLKSNWRLAIDTLNQVVSKPLQPGESEKEEDFRCKIHSILNAMKKSLHLSKDNVSSQMSSSSSSGSVKKSKSDTDLKKQAATINSNSKSGNLNECLQQLKRVHYLIKDHLYSIQYLSMFNVAPDLFLLRNSVVCVPGTYDVKKPKILIKQFDPTLEIYNSKQRPRFLVIYGDDGSRHKSLLKGREDLRLDCRLMQFFRLINGYIGGELDGQIKAKIFRYSITPVTRKCGLIQFVDGADTIFSLITEYRRARSSNIFEEMTIETAFGAPNVDSLRPIQRVEALQEARSLTRDDDLRRTMCLNSPSSEKLIARTIMFSQSSAVMSIVGYVLGIGDRHPSNILVRRTTGEVIHIDFGDFFETAKNRKLFPELVPFRLTRMMIRAFGPSEVEGDFRMTCEQTLLLIRRHVFALMSILDIFKKEPIEDPLKSDPKKSVVLTKSAKKRKRSPAEGEEDEEDVDSVDVDVIDEEKGEFNSPDINDCIKRVGEKIIGKDPDLANDDGDVNKYPCSIENQVAFLIRKATDEYNLAYLYHGWTPLW